MFDKIISGRSKIIKYAAYLANFFKLNELLYELNLNNTIVLPGESHNILPV